MPLTKLSLGGSAFGGVFTPMSDDQCLTILRRAFNAGMSLIDTAPWYQASERVLGRCLRKLAAEVPRDRYQLNTKVGRYPTGKMFDFSAARVARSVEDSLAALQVDYIDTIQVHDCEFGDEDVIVNETLPLLDELRRAGKVRRIGITGYELGTLRRIIERSSVRIDAVLSYCRYTLNDRALVERVAVPEQSQSQSQSRSPSAAAGEANVDDGAGEDFVSFLERHNIQLINASAIAMGLLCNKEPPAWHPASDDLKQRCVAASAYAEAHGCNLARLALGFVLRHPRIPTTLVSVTNMDFMEANLDVMQNGLTAAEQGVLDEVLARFFPTSENWEGVEKGRMRGKKKEAGVAKAEERKNAAEEKVGDVTDSNNKVNDGKVPSDDKVGHTGGGGDDDGAKKHLSVPEEAEEKGDDDARESEAKEPEPTERAVLVD